MEAPIPQLPEMLTPVEDPLLSSCPQIALEGRKLPYPWPSRTLGAVPVKYLVTAGIQRLVSWPGPQRHGRASPVALSQPTTSPWAPQGWFPGLSLSPAARRAQGPHVLPIFIFSASPSPQPIPWHSLQTGFVPFWVLYGSCSLEGAPEEENGSFWKQLWSLLRGRP